MKFAWSNVAFPFLLRYVDFDLLFATESKTMTISFSCPNCSKTYNVSDDKAGKKTKCPACETSITVPSADAASSPPAAAPPPQPPISVAKPPLPAVPSKPFSIPAEENIEVGVSLNASPAMLHRKLVSSLSGTTLPLDVLDKVEVVREERFAVPAYIFDCNATASVTYEQAKEVTNRTVKDLGDKVRETTYTDVQWDPQSTNVSATAMLVIPGSKTDDQPIQKVYANFDSSRLDGIRDLQFPSNTELRLFGMSNSMAFNGYAKPIAEKLLEREVEKLAGGKQVRNVHLGGSNIQKGNAEKALLGLYRIRYKYNGSEYSFWTAGDGIGSWHDKPLPPDPQRQRTYDTLSEAASVEPKSASLYGCAHAVFFVIGCFTVGVGFLGNAAMLAVYFFQKKNADEHNEQIAKAKRDLEAFKAEKSSVVQRFKGQKKALNGIYSGCTGDASAF
jgi:DNA-directed RNA polymerase subunit RPC12/RpoP